MHEKRKVFKPRSVADGESGILAPLPAQFTPLIGREQDVAAICRLLLHPDVRLLTGGPGTSPDRQQTLRKTLQWSYDLLEHEEQALFRRLAVFAGGGPLSAAEALGQEAGRGSPDILNTLASLLDHSLIHQSEQEAEEPRFLMLQTVREFGLELLAATGELQTIQAARAHFFLRLSEQAEPELQGPHATRWLERLEQEHDNLHGALAWLFQEAGEQIPK